MRSPGRRASSTRRDRHPPARSGPLVVGTALAILAGFGCAGRAALDRRMVRLSETLALVEANGAMRCAPRELAIARSQLEFARLEEEQGFPSRASQHYEVAEENIQAASVLSPPERCSGQVAPSGSPAPTGSPR
jgi:hypothetical protein